MTDPSGDNDDDDAADAASDRAHDAARLLLITAAPLPYMIWLKWEVLEFYLADDGECAWADNRQIAFLGCIKGT